MSEGKYIIKLVDRDNDDFIFFEGSPEKLKKILPEWNGTFKNGDIVNINGIQKWIIQTNIEYQKNNGQVVTLVFQDRSKSIYK